MLGPSVGGLELLVVALLALIVVGPKDLPLLLRKVGKFVGRARKMASEFRASFDDMARQSELDDLRKEVEALRSGQLTGLGKDATTTFKDIDKDLKAPVLPKSAAMSVTGTPPLNDSSLDKTAHDEIVAQKMAEAELAAPRPSEPPAPEAPAKTSRRKQTSQPPVAAKARASRRKTEA